MSCTTSIRLAVLALVAATVATQNACLWAVPLYTIDNVQTNVGPGEVAGLGYDFTTTRPLMIEAVGAYDHNGTDIQNVAGGSDTVVLFNGVTQSIILTDTVLSTDPATALDGGFYTSGDAFRYHTLSTPVLLPAGSYQLLSDDAAGISILSRTRAVIHPSAGSIS